MRTFTYYGILHIFQINFVSLFIYACNYFWGYSSVFLVVLCAIKYRNRDATEIIIFRVNNGNHESHLYFHYKKSDFDYGDDNVHNIFQIIFMF